MKRPDSEQFRKILLSPSLRWPNESTGERLGRNSREAYEFMCEYYEKHIESLTNHLRDTEQNNTILADLELIKAMLYDALNMGNISGCGHEMTTAIEEEVNGTKFFLRCKICGQKKSTSGAWIKTSV